jgi:hypothetical protein
MALSTSTFELESSLDPPTPSIINSFSLVVVIPPILIAPSLPSINSLSSSSKKSPSFELCYRSINIATNPPHLNGHAMFHNTQ